MHLRLALLAIVSSALAEEAKPTVESLQAEVSTLKQQLAQSEQRFQFEMAVCAGALQGARQAALKPAEPSPLPVKPRRTPSAQ